MGTNVLIRARGNKVTGFIRTFLVLAKAKPSLSRLKEKCRWCIRNSDVSRNDGMENGTEPSEGRAWQPEI